MGILIVGACNSNLLTSNINKDRKKDATIYEC